MSSKTTLRVTIAVLVAGLIALALYMGHGDAEAAVPLPTHDKAGAALQEGAHELAGQQALAAQVAIKEADDAFRKAAQRKPNVLHHTTAKTSAPTVGGGPAVPVLVAIRWCEAGRYLGLPFGQTNYSARTHGYSGASGGYQILRSTWLSWRTYVPGAEQYDAAYLAPSDIQDAVAQAALSRNGTTPWNPSRSCWGRYARR